MGIGCFFISNKEGGKSPWEIRRERNEIRPLPILYTSIAEI
jgi:hypothetical protein